ncbi:DNA cytosine methyltransferase [Janthinobacterium sp. AD80]|uniref:DNA cytosine methyltransferase n=1 Tax=Janthinobacterium sp. AD80 TaxID=1528773 RepID=UPI000CB3EBA2|nr:DNA cytosine methyltransferase [Janthinobacterium sp. AD80]PMQ16973.1 putative BsuMI modification methylase subunit YdiP [Janthinobacterium sp. AD80]
MKRDSFTTAMPITFGSVCSGLEAASVAWGPLGWRAAWLAEIEPFPCAVLAHHYPDVPNLGDMTKVAALIRDGFVPAPDVFCGGTPCQAFSIAGLRNSLDDERGNLSLVFCEIADEIDARRAAAGLLPAVVFWENVPGVLSTKDNAFGCFLAGLAGEDDPIEPAGGKWAYAGCVYGPARTVAWRTLDAQYFGVAQRRRRVFVIASAGEGFDPAQVLFEFDGLRRDSPPSRESPQDIAGTVRASAARRGGVQDECGLGLQPVSTEDIGGARQVDGKDIAFGASVAAPVARSVERPRGDGLDTLIAGTLQANGKAAGSATQQDAEAGMLIPMAFGGNNQAGEIHVATACRAHAGPHLDFESETFLVQQVAYPIQNATRGKDQNGLGIGDAGAPMYTLDNGSQHGVALAPIAFSSKDYGGDACYDLSPTLRAGNHAGSHANAGIPPAIAFDARQDCVSSTSVLGALGTSSPQAQAVCIIGDITHTLKAEGFDASEDGTGRGQPIVAAFAENSRAEIRLEGGDGSRTGALSTGGGKPGQGVPMVLAGMAVRRLTPRECERLQAFPDDYTLIPFGRTMRPEKLDQDWIKYLLRGGVMTRDQVARAAADGPRYKAIGNSWAVSNVAWLGRRIDAAMRANFAHEREIARVA